MRFQRNMAQHYLPSIKLLFASLFLAMLSACHYPNTVIPVLRRLAKEGDPVAMNELGHLYAEGQGVRKSPKKATKWFSQAAEKGMPLAQFNMGLCYMTGFGVKQDFPQCVAYFTDAAKQGNDNAAYNLGFLHYYGIGTHRDPQKAISWYEKAARNHDTEASYRLGLMYWNGDGVPENDTLAFHWFKESANYGLPKAQFAVGTFYQFGIATKRNLGLSRLWLKKARRQGFNAAEENTCYLKLGIADEIRRDIPIALLEKYRIKHKKPLILEYPRAVASLSESDSLYHQGFNLLFGIEAPENPQEAIECLTAAVFRDNLGARMLLAYCYSTATGVLLNQEAAAHLFVGKGEIRYFENDGEISILFEIYKDGSFDKTISFRRK